MRIYLINDSKTIDPSLLDKIKLDLKKYKIYKEFTKYSNTTELKDIVSKQNITKSTTIILIGEDYDFEELTNYVAKNNHEPVIGFIPVDHSKTIKYLNIDGWKKAIEAISQRKIKEIIAHSANNRFFINQLKISSVPAALSVLVNLDNKLSVEIPSCEISIKDISEENLTDSKSLKLVARELPQTENKKADMLGGLINRIGITGSTSKTRMLLGMDTDKVKIESSNDGFEDKFGRKYKSPLNIGSRNSVLRIIVGKNALDNS